MESQRSFLVIGLVLVSFLLWQQWQQDYGPQPIAPIDNGPSKSGDINNGTFIPAPANDQSLTDSYSGKIITVKTNALSLQIDLNGGDVVSADLLKYPVTQGAEESYSLLRPGQGLYVAQSGLTGRDGPDASPDGRPVYTSARSAYSLENSQSTLSIPIVWQSDNVTVTKTFELSADGQDVSVSYSVKNSSSTPIQIQQYAQLKQTTVQEDSSMFMPTYRGAAYSTDEERYEKHSFSDIEDSNLRENTLGGWVAMLEHYFVSAWIPPQEEQNNLYSRILNNGFAVIGFTGNPVTIQPGETTQLHSILYLGPKDQDYLATLARGLDLTVDYGVLWWISQPLFGLLKMLYQLTTNWGFAIILITIIVKGLMYPLTKKQYESMAKMRNLSPKIQQLKDRYGDDRQKMSQAMMEMYRKDKVNPMGGCFPLLLQMPIFLALYWVLLESVELRHADFALWITDLSVKDPFFVLPILTGASMYLLQKLQPTTMTDPMQQKIMQFMPVFMSVFFLWFPAGLVLYWLISNVITLIQAKIIYSSMEKRGLNNK